jgi:HPt (histidine-containing phosphotransfer) domain-containing protein
MADPADAVQTQLAKLRAKYGLALPGKISGIAAAVASFFAAPWDEQACSTAHRQVHSLAGSSGTYGFPAISGVARSAEAILKQSLEARALPAPSLKSQVDDLVAKLREMAADAAGQGTP